LLRAAAALGSDVPFFLYEKGWALGRGRGEIIEPLPLGASFFHLLVAPGFLIPTKDVYRAYSLPAGQAGLTPSGSDVTLLLEALRKGDVLEVRALLFNALEPAAESLYPALSDVKATITAKTGLERPTVSGSGSSVFALCESRAQAMEAAGLLRRERSDWRVWVVQTKG
ncbi:MAG: hypothetical protein HYZ90_02935, partial [Candidatus Omnitrophica bacterium]|nr:hypothetical protein [Candidatus Omnitrophota bacterium]